MFLSHPSFGLFDWERLVRSFPTATTTSCGLHRINSLALPALLHLFRHDIEHGLGRLDRTGFEKSQNLDSLWQRCPSHICVLPSEEAGRFFDQATHLAAFAASKLSPRGDSLIRHF